MKDDKKVPQLRFPEFTDAWKQRKLRDIGAIVTGNTPKTSDKGNYGNDYLFVSPADIQQNRYIKNTQTKLTKKGFLTGKPIRKGASLFVCIGSTIGKVAQTVEESVSNQQINALIPFVSFCDDFVFTLLETLALKVKSIASNQAVPIINKSTFGSTECLVPSIIEEQQKIGAFFTQLDSTITLQQRKLNSLQKLKKGLLQKMFPKKGENIPEIRFPEFSDAWKQRKFGDFAKVSMCKRIFKEETTQTGDVPFFKIGTFGGIPDAFISRYKFESYKAKYPYPKKGDILISASGSIGRIVEYSGKDEYFQDSNIIWLDHDESVLNSFLKHVYSIIKWNGIEGTTIKRLYNDNVLTTKILTPSLEEQSKIGTFFTQLDNTITLQQRKLESLQKLKKGLLQQMFI